MPQTARKQALTATSPGQSKLRGGGRDLSDDQMDDEEYTGVNVPQIRQEAKGGGKRGGLRG
ncbi:hypothetical protein H1R20_g6650, partial [Candolleomyces eurysporus]